MFVSFIIVTLQTFVRTLFDYDPRADDFIPCQQAGIGFKRGEVLQIVSKTDPHWWQVSHDVSHNHSSILSLLLSLLFEIRLDLVVDLIVCHLEIIKLGLLLLSFLVL